MLDQWHLPLGGDMYHFMEQSVRSAEFVIIVCTPAYAAKADARNGGVGYEARIITTELAHQTEQRKFIPILRSGEYPSAAPVWLASRSGLNFTSTSYSTKELERLLRTLHGEEIQAPPLGPKPVFYNAPPFSSSIAAPRNVGAGSAHRLALGDELDNTERELLDAAVKDSSGQISHRRPIGSDQIFTNGRNFINAANPRSSAGWKGALESLQLKGLIRATSYEKHFYAVTAEGYGLAEQLGPFVRWTTSEVLLQAFYFGNYVPEAVTVECSGLIVVPPVYYKDQHGTDGTAMRSIKQRRGLLVEGIDPRAMASLNFEPTDVQFEDADAREEHQFRIARRTTPDQHTLFLELEDSN